MDSITRLEEIVQTVLGEQANQFARETRFLIRQRKLSGADFVQGLVFGWLHHPDARLSQLLGALGRLEVQISESGLSQRFTETAALFLQRVLDQLVQHTLGGQAVPVEVLNRFSAVIVEDSSVITLPDELRTHWPGCGGGDGQSRAGLKLHVRYELLTGALEGPVVTASKVADQRSPLREQPLAPGQLYVTDEGYFGLRWLKAQTEANECFFLTRPRSTTAFFDRQGHRLDLVSIGPTEVNQSLDLPVLVGCEVRLPARLIMLRVPEQVAQERQEHLCRQMQRHSNPSEPSERQLQLCCWTILITNVPVERLSVAEVLVIQRARWQIERLFRLWKEHGMIDEWRGKSCWRILCEVFGKLMAQVIQQWVLSDQLWQDPYRSLVKAAAVVRDHALDFLDALHGKVSFAWLFERISRDLAYGCRVGKRKDRPCLAQLWIDGLPWPLT